MEHIVAEKIRDGSWTRRSVHPCRPKLNEEPKITILTYESMWEMRPFTRFMRFPRSSGYKNHSIEGAVCSFATSRLNFANEPLQICAQAAYYRGGTSRAVIFQLHHHPEDLPWNPVFFTNHGFF